MNRGFYCYSPRSNHALYLLGSQAGLLYVPMGLFSVTPSSIVICLTRPYLTPSYLEGFEEVSEELLGDKGKHEQVWVVWVAAASQSGPHPGSADGWGLSIEAQPVYCQLLLHAFYLEFFPRPLIHPATGCK